MVADHADSKEFNRMITLGLILSGKYSAIGIGDGKFSESDAPHKCPPSSFSDGSRDTSVLLTSVRGERTK